VAITLEEAKGKVPVLGGAGGNDTAKVIEMAREIERMAPTEFFRHAILQQADAGRSLPSITRHRVLDLASHHFVQRAPANQREHRARHVAPPGRNRKHYRRQGSLGNHRANDGK